MLIDYQQKFHAKPFRSCTRSTDRDRETYKDRETHISRQRNTYVKTEKQIFQER